MGVKVIVDYTTGTYRVIGSRNGKVETISKPIRGVDKEDGFFKANFSRNLITKRKNEIKERLDELQDFYYDFKYSKKLLDKVDPMVFKALKTWDEMAGTQYADDYLMAATEEISKPKNPGEPKDFYKDEYRKARQKNLDQAGIDLSYNVGLFNANSDLTFMDKIRGRKFARTQRELFSGININDNLFLKSDYYLEDETDFINKEKDKNNIKNTVNKTTNLEEIKFEFPEMPSRTNSEDSKIDIPVKRQSQNKFSENYIIDLGKDKADSQEISNGKEKVEIPILNSETKKQESKRTIKKPYIPKGKKAKRYQNKDKKKRVRNHTGQRPGLTKRQRKSAELKEQRSKTFYEAQMERNERREKEKAAAKARYEEYLKQQTEIKEQLSENNTLETQAKELEEIIKRSTELEEKAKAERLKAEKRLAEMMEAKPEIDTDKKDLDKENDSKQEATKRIQRTNSSKLERRLAAEKRHWKRKIRGEKDSIRNKERKPLSKRAKRAILTGVISIAAAGIVVTSVGVTGNRNNFGKSNDVAVTESVDKNTEKQDNTSNKKSSNQVHESDKEKDTVEDSETSTKKENNDSKETKNNSSGAKENASTENKTSEANTPNIQEEKTPEQIVQEFHEEAKRAYTTGVIIGKQPCGDLLDNQTYSEKPEGTGKTGHFAEHPEFRVEFINIVTPDGWKTVRDEGKSLAELLEENPDYITYNFHVVDSKTGGWLGFVTQEQYEKLIDEKANQIIQEKNGKTANQNQTQEKNDLER